MAYFGEMALVVGILIVMLLGSKKMATKIKQNQFNNKKSHNGLISMKDIIDVGPNQRVYLLKVKGEDVLLSLTSHGSTMIKLDAHQSKTFDSDFEREMDEFVGEEMPELKLQSIGKKFEEKMKK